MIADSVAMMAKAGRKVDLRRRALLRRLAGQPASTPWPRCGPRATPGPRCLVLCDTNGGSLPEQIAECVQAVRAAMGEVPLGIHCHNDGGLAVANTLAAVRAGVTHVQGTINGIGERCGNADLTAIIPNLVLKYGYRCLREGTLKNLTEVSRFVYEVANLNLRENQPFVGSAAFAHKGGMHVHAVARNVTTYEHVDPAAVGNSRRILVSELSGVSNIAATAPRQVPHRRRQGRPAEGPRRPDGPGEPGLPVRGGRGQLRGAHPKDPGREVVPPALGAGPLPLRHLQGRRARLQHRGQRQAQAGRARSSTPSPRATARWTRWTRPCGRPCAGRTRRWTTCTWWTTRSAW